MEDMMQSREDIRRLAEASAWRVRLSEEELETNDGFETWLAADPRNGTAWDHVQADWLFVGEQSTSPELLKLRRDVLGRARRQGSSRWDVRSRVLALAASIILVVFMGIAAGGYWWHLRPVTYETAMGERRVITLADGSKATLDAATTLEVRYSDSARKIALIRGQARFDVAHDITRPFSVRARDRTIIATGTEFNVDLLGPRLLVTLIEGRVVIIDSKSGVAPLTAFLNKPANAIALSPGQQLNSSPTTMPRVETVSLDRTSAWESGSLVFDDETLDSVAERIGRYSAEPMVVAPDVANLKMSGVFKVGDIATFVDAISRYLPVTATEQNGKIVISRRA